MNLRVGLVRARFSVVVATAQLVQVVFTTPALGVLIIDGDGLFNGTVQEAVAELRGVEDPTITGILDLLEASTKTHTLRETFELRGSNVTPIEQRGKVIGTIIEWENTSSERYQGDVYRDPVAVLIHELTHAADLDQGDSNCVGGVVDQTTGIEFCEIKAVRTENLYRAAKPVDRDGDGLPDIRMRYGKPLLEEFFEPCISGTVRSCYTGPPGTENIGICRAGNTTCDQDGHGYFACETQILPGTESCTNTTDDNCNGLTDCADATCSTEPPCGGPSCGDDVREGSEECDGFDDSVCPGQCGPDCTCPSATSWLASPIVASCMGPTDSFGTDWRTITFDTTDSGWVPINLPEGTSTQPGPPYGDSLPQGEDRFYRGEFDLQEIPSDASIFLQCDNQCEVWINGNLLGSFAGPCHTSNNCVNIPLCSPTCLPPQSIPEAFLQNGTNVVAVHLSNASGPSWLDARIFTGTSGSCGNCTIDAGEECDPTAPNGPCPRECAPPGTANACRCQEYVNHFEGPVGPEWSRTDLATASGGRNFLGEFANDLVTLTLSALPSHSRVRLSFDLFILKSWDGNSSAHGPDEWQVSVHNGSTLLHTTFSNCHPVSAADGQAYPDRYPGGQNPCATGASEVDTLGYVYAGIPMDAVYQVSRAFSHSGSSLVLDFSATLRVNSDTSDESWGLDNVVVELLP